jgi:hypothetical protein
MMKKTGKKRRRKMSEPRITRMALVALMLKFFNFTLWNLRHLQHLRICGSDIPLAEVFLLGF